MAVNAVQSGQIWRCDETRETWLVTRTYTEMFTSYAVLRKVAETARPDQSDQDVQRVKVERSDAGTSLRGFTLVEEG